MKQVRKSINVIIILLILFVTLQLIGCKEHDRESGITYVKPYINGGEPQTFPKEIPDMSPKLLEALEEIGASNTPLLTFVDNKNGDIRIVKHPEYEIRTPSRQVPAKEINNVTSISIVDFKNSPGCRWINVDGSEVFVCQKI